MKLLTRFSSQQVTAIILGLLILFAVVMLIIRLTVGSPNYAPNDPLAPLARPTTTTYGTISKERLLERVGARPELIIDQEQKADFLERIGERTAPTFTEQQKQDLLDRVNNR